ncbi:hypothetical protein FQN54_003190 [Arachnomyces sp. PD_36]|nr:hypothetical protein FQN54_003190 [Arachnomyces sp. PD_36]
MNIQISDRVLWVGLGVSLFLAARSVSQVLYQVRELTQIKNDEKEDHVIGEGTEEALKLETLQKLSESTSFDLRTAALRIVSDRSTKGSTRDLLLSDLASKDKVRRGKALTAFHFLISNRALARSTISNRLVDLPTYTAVVDCLCNFLEEHTEETSTTISPILPRTRPLGEKKALLILDNILGANVPAALEAGVVSRWLSKYPFPCTTKDESKRRNVVLLMKSWWSDDMVMGTIFSTLTSNQDGILELQNHGLMGNVLEELDEYAGDDEEYDPRYEDNSSDVFMTDGEDTAGARRWSGPRRRDGSIEDQALRRRRREAMVLSEGGWPLSRDNIIQPLQGGRDEELENELEQLMEEVNREDEEAEAAQLAAAAGQEGTDEEPRSWQIWPF